MLFNEFITFNLFIRIFNIDGNISKSILIFFNYFFHLKESLFYNIFNEMLKIILDYHLDTVKLSSQSVIIFFNVKDLYFLGFKFLLKIGYLLFLDL